MRFDIMTLFPEMVMGVLGESIIGRAVKAGFIEVNAHNFRDYSEDKHKRVDDTPYGGGKGMLLKPEPIYNCYLAITDPATNKCERRHVIFMSPQGKIFNQQRRRSYAIIMTT